MAYSSESTGGKTSELDFESLLPPHAASTLIAAWLENDIPSFDTGGLVVGEKDEVATLLGKSAGILAGKPFFDAVFKAVGCKVQWFMEEGERFTPIKIAAKVTGPARCILLGERTALNIITRASGIATKAAEMTKIAKDAGWHGEVAGTRKTTPGFRLVEKYALLVGGASTHRMNLSSMVMLKDNHIWSSGGIAPAVKKARAAAGFSTKIEVECRSLDEAIEASTAGADIVMLDNYTPDELKADAERLKKRFPHVTVEASGGITRKTISKYFSPFVDVVSMGSLTQGYGALDFSLKILREGESAEEFAGRYRSKL